MSLRLSDHGILISKRLLGEGKHLLTFFTKTHGQVKGVARISKKNPLDLGAFCLVHWSARLEEQLGFLDVELIKSTATFLLGDYTKLLALQSMMQLLTASLVDRHPYPKLYGVTTAFLIGADDTPWQAAYIRFELTYLEELGFGLDLSQCALTGGKDNLYYLSPNTGRACTQEAGSVYKEKLFRIPDIFKHATALDFYDALNITGYFLKKHLFHHSLPQARLSLLNESHQRMKAL